MKIVSLVVLLMAAQCAARRGDFLHATRQTSLSLSAAKRQMCPHFQSRDAGASCSGVIIGQRDIVLHISHRMIYFQLRNAALNSDKLMAEPEQPAISDKATSE